MRCFSAVLSSVFFYIEVHRYCKSIGYIFFFYNIVSLGFTNIGILIFLCKSRIEIKFFSNRNYDI